MKKMFILLFVFMSYSQALAMPKVDVIDSIIKLDLSDQQKSEIATILKKSRVEVKPKVEMVMEARKKLSEVSRREDFDENQIRLASKEFAKAHEELAVVKAKVLSNVMKVLNAEQRKVISELRNSVGKKIGKRFAKARKLINYWIDKNAKA